MIYDLYFISMLSCKNWLKVSSWYKKGGRSKELMHCSQLLSIVCLKTLRENDVHDEIHQ
jgi:hypothetical protein